MNTLFAPVLDFSTSTDASSGKFWGEYRQVREVIGYSNNEIIGRVMFWRDYYGQYHTTPYALVSLYEAI